MLMGNADFGALFVRAIALTKTEFTGMSELEIQPSGTLIELDPAELKANLPELSRVSVRVLAEFEKTIFNDQVPIHWRDIDRSSAQTF